MATISDERLPIFRQLKPLFVSRIWKYEFREINKMLLAVLDIFETQAEERPPKPIIAMNKWR